MQGRETGLPWPWLSVFDPTVTTSATRGYYVVYLFHASEPLVHLSLNQGATAVIQEFGRKAMTVLRDRAAIIRARLGDYATNFDIYELDPGDVVRDRSRYELTHWIGCVNLVQTLKRIGVAGILKGLTCAIDKPPCVARP